MTAHEFEQTQARGTLTTRCVTCNKRIARATGCNVAGMAYAYCGHAEECLRHIGVSLEPYQSKGYFQDKQSFRVRSQEGVILGHVGRRHSGHFGGDHGYRTRSGRWVRVRYASMGFAAFQMIYSLGYDGSPKRVEGQVAG